MTLSLMRAARRGLGAAGRALRGRSSHVEAAGESSPSAITRLLEKVGPLLEAHAEGAASGAPVVRYVPAEELRRRVDFSLPDAAPATPEEGEERVVSGVRAALEHSVRTGSPMFLDKLYSGSDATGQTASLVSSALNTNVHVYATSPFFSVCEREVVRASAGLFGFDPDQADGVFVPGGSYANLAAMVLARNTHAATAAARVAGMSAPAAAARPVVLSSRQSHYSLARAAMVCGVGLERGVGWVRADRRGRMCAEDLDRQVRRLRDEEGAAPFFVQATSGTTVMGGFDPLDEVAAVCREHGLWLHVDAAWGGSAAVSRRHRHLLRGSGLADSLAWNPHKGLGVPLQCSLLLTRRGGELERSNSSNAEYLFHRHADSDYDLGDKTLQCGRKPDAFKLWLAWRRYGLAGFEARVDRAFANARELHAMARERRGRFETVLDCADEPHESANVCFWFVPPSARALAGEAERLEAAGRVTAVIYQRMQERGRMLVNFNPLPEHGLPPFFRAIMNGPNLGRDGLASVLDEIEELGSDL